MDFNVKITAGKMVALYRWMQHKIVTSFMGPV